MSPEFRPINRVPLRPPPEVLSQSFDFRAEAAKAAAEQQKRWRIIDKLRNRRNKARRIEARRDGNRADNFRENYMMAAHFLINIVTRLVKDPERREERRARLERRMRVSQLGRLRNTPS